MKNHQISKAAKRALCFALALTMISAGTLSVFADEYDISDGSVSVSLNGGCVQTITQTNVCENKPDDNIVIKGSSDKNGVTVDAGTTVTLDAVNIYDSSGDNNLTPLTVTDNNNTGEAATVIMIGSSLHGGDQNSVSQYQNTPGILVEEGASLDLQVAGNNDIWSGFAYGVSGEVTTAGIQLEDGATVTISDNTGTGYDYGKLEVAGGRNQDNYWSENGGAGIGTENHSDASVTINIVQNQDLSVEAYSGWGVESGAAIGTGAHSSGDVTVNINGGEILGSYQGDDRSDGIGLGSGASGKKTIYVDGDADLSANDWMGNIQIYTLKVDGNSYYYEILDRDWFSDAFAQANGDENELFAILSANAEKANRLIPAPPEEAAEEPVEANAVPAAVSYISAGAFAASFVSAVGEYLPEIGKLKGSTDAETFDNFKGYIEQNRLFDTEGLSSGTKLTAGQIAVIFCQAAGIKLSGGDKEAEALAQLGEKGILKNCAANAKLPAQAAKKAIEQFTAEFLANK